MNETSPEVPEEYGAKGAVPPTEGVAPVDAPPDHSPATARSAADDLADGLDLLLRAARKAAGTVDPRIERAAEQALGRLQALDAGMTREFARRTSAFAPRLEQVARETGKELTELVRKLSERIESTIKP